MEENRSFVLPADGEKLSHKFIFDSLRRRQADAPPPVDAEAEPEPPPVAALPPEAPVLASEKMYFRIGEVSELLGVEPHVLRYWESEFPSVRPEKSGGQRVYRRKDVETLGLIRHLLHVEKFSIKGAKKRLRVSPPAIAAAPAAADQTVLKEIAAGLRELIRTMA